MRVQSFRATLGRNYPLLAFFLSLYYLICFFWTFLSLAISSSVLCSCFFALWQQRMRLFLDVQSSVVNQHAYIIGGAARKHSSIRIGAQATNVQPPRIAKRKKNSLSKWRERGSKSSQLRTDFFEKLLTWSVKVFPPKRVYLSKKKEMHIPKRKIGRLKKKRMQ